VFWVISGVTANKTRKGGEEMDFLTGMAYWGIIVLTIINAIIVSKMKINIGNK
jgi:hypothetical protein